MKYKNWSKTKINELYNKAYEQYILNPTDENIYIFNSMVDLKNNNFSVFPHEDIFSDQVINDKNTINNYSSFNNDLEYFSKLNNCLKIKSNIELEEYNIKVNLLLSFVHDFYNSIDKDFAKYFNRVFKDKKYNLRLTNYLNDKYHRSYMLYLDKLNYAFLSIYLNSTVEDFINIVHEYAHCIADQMKYRDGYDDNYPFVELLPLFMQFIAYDKINEWFCFEDEVDKSRALLTKEVLKCSNEIVLQSNYLNNMPCYKDKKTFISDFAKFSGNTKAKTQKLFDSTLIEKLSYVLPYITAIELYYLYKRDPEKCLYITKKIICLDNCNDYKKYLSDNGIELNEHSKEFVEEDMQRVKKIKYN